MLVKLSTVFMEPSGSVQKMVGEELRLVCTARGDPTPSVSWEKIGGYIPDQVSILYNMAGNFFSRAIFENISLNT